MRLLAILELLYHVDRSGVVTVIDNLSESAKKDLIALCAKGRAKIEKIDVPTSDQARVYNIFTFISRIASAEPFNNKEDSEALLTYVVD